MECCLFWMRALSKYGIEFVSVCASACAFVGLWNSSADDRNVS